MMGRVEVVTRGEGLSIRCHCVTKGSTGEVVVLGAIDVGRSLDFIESISRGLWEKLRCCNFVCYQIGGCLERLKEKYYI